MFTIFKCLLAFLTAVSLAGPTLAVSPIAGHNRRTLCRPRPSLNSSHLPSSSTSQAPSTPSLSTFTTLTAYTKSTTPQPELTPPALPPPSYKKILATSSSSSSLTPNGIKAGVAGGDAYNILRDHIGWWYDWSASPSKPGKPIAIPMLWGGGNTDSTDAARYAQFQRLAASASAHPQFVLGYEEPDCRGGGSSGMSVDQGVKEWEALMAPLKKRGAKIGSPSMCKQADETWLKEFSKKISTPWDFTAIHVNKNNLAGVQNDIDHYWKTYGKPIWVTEFACVNDHNTFQPCTNQQQINSFIYQVVDYFEHENRIQAYAFSNGLGLGNVWPMMHNGVFSESGKAYLAAIRKYH